MFRVLCVCLFTALKRTGTCWPHWSWTHSVLTKAATYSKRHSLTWLALSYMTFFFLFLFSFSKRGRWSSLSNAKVTDTPWRSAVLTSRIFLSPLPSKTAIIVPIRNPHDREQDSIVHLCQLEHRYSFKILTCFLMFKARSIWGTSLSSGEWSLHVEEHPCSVGRCNPKMEVPVRPGQTVNPRPELTRGPFDPHSELSNEPLWHSAPVDLGPGNITFNTLHPIRVLA